MNPMALFLTLSAGATAGIILYAATASRGIGITNEWAWEVVRQPRFDSLGGPVFLSGLLLLGLVWTARRQPLGTRAREAAAVGGLVLLNFLLQIALGGLGQGGNIEAIFASFPPANSYYGRALEISSAEQYLAEYHREIEKSPFRVQLSTHPPGSVLYYYAFLKAGDTWPSGALAVRSLARKLTPLEEAYQLPEIAQALEKLVRPEQEGAAWAAAFFLRLAASLAVIPAYLLCRMQWPAGQALILAAAASTIPALFLFSPHPDQIFPFLAGMFLWLVMASLRHNSAWAAAASGVAAFTGLFFSLSFLLPLATAAAMCAMAVARQRSRIQLVLAAAGLAGFLLPALFLLMVYDHNVLSVWKACSAQNDEFNRHSGRTYWKWLMFNPLELAIFAGAPVFFLFWSGWIREADRRWLEGTAEGAAESGGPANALFPPGPAEGDASKKNCHLSDLLIALGAALALLNLSGKNLGEVGRLWMIVMPVMIPAASGIWHRWGPVQQGAILAAIVLQLAQTIGLRVTVDALGLFFSASR